MEEMNKMKLKHHSSKHSRVTSLLRKMICAGDYANGRRLPVQQELMEKFKVSSSTIQKALGQLETEGFIEKRQKFGTKLVEQPPHLSNIGIVFPFDPKSAGYYSKFYRTVSRAAEEYQLRNKRPFLQFHGVNETEYSPERQRLMDYVLTHRLSGIIFAGPGFEFAGTPILDEPDIPRVTMGIQSKYPEIPAVCFNSKSFIEQAFDHLISRGLEKIAVITSFLDETHTAELSELIASYKKIYCPKQWRLELSLREPFCAHSCARLLASDPSNRPDGLIITDDNLAEYAIGGLFDAGIRIPEDIEVVEHCNFPCPPGTARTTRLGLNVEKLVSKCVELLDNQRAGEQVELFSYLSAVFA